MELTPETLCHWLFCIQEESLSGYRIKRIIDGAEKADFLFDSSYKLQTGRKVKVSTPGLNFGGDMQR